jgi:peptidoglycan/LPS O-acetylase OafA/YrhL
VTGDNASSGRPVLGGGGGLSEGRAILAPMPIHPGATNFINLSRWAAALAVLIAHTRGMVFAVYPGGGAGLPQQGFYFVTGLGHEAVIVFFVASGFLVGGLTLQRTLETGFAPGAYFAHRVSRIYTVYLPALGVGALLDWLGSRYFNAAELYTNSAKYHQVSIESIPVHNLNAPTFLGNLLMWQGSDVPGWGRVQPFGSNVPLWTLSMEWWYYCLFALALLAFGRRSRLATALCILAMVLIGLALSKTILLWMVIWLMGVGCWAYWRYGRRRINPWLALAIFLATLTVSKLAEHTVKDAGVAVTFARDALVGVGYSALLIAMLKGGVRPVLGRLNARLADYSYSLYLVHFPVLLFFVAAANATLGAPFLLPFRPWPFGYATILLVLVLAFVFIFHALTEAHTGAVRRWLASLGRRRETSAPTAP